MKAFLGVDPGKQGCACLLTTDGPLFSDWSNEIDMQATLELWQRDYTIQGAVLEQVSAMRGQGVTSMFSFGANYGWWKCALQWMRISWREVRPQTWQRAVGITPKSGKQGAYIVASRLYPTAELTGPKGGIKDGRADALLLAHYIKERS